MLHGVMDASPFQYPTSDLSCLNEDGKVVECMSKDDCFYVNCLHKLAGRDFEAQCSNSHPPVILTTPQLYCHARFQIKNLEILMCGSSPCDYKACKLEICL